MRSVRLIWALCAARWAMRSLLTRCSGVSPGILEGFGAADEVAGEAAALDVA